MRSLQPQRRAHALARRFGREDAGHGGAAADRGIDRHRPAVQLDERAHQREAQAGAAVARAERVGLEPVEHLVADVGRDARALVGDHEHDRVLQPLRRQRHGAARRREADGVGEQIEQRLTHAPLVGDERADVGRGADRERNAGLLQAVLHAFGGGVHGLADVDVAEVERHRAGVDGGEVEDVVDDREQRVGRGGDVAQILVLLRRSAGRWSGRRGNARSR